MRGRETVECSLVREGLSAWWCLDSQAGLILMFIEKLCSSPGSPGSPGSEHCYNDKQYLPARLYENIQTKKHQTIRFPVLIMKIYSFAQTELGRLTWKFYLKCKYFFTGFAWAQSIIESTWYGTWYTLQASLNIQTDIISYWLMLVIIKG